MTSVSFKSWLSFETSFKNWLGVALQRADDIPYIQGWRANNVRERINAFIQRGVSAQVGCFSVPVHGWHEGQVFGFQGTG